MAAFQTWPLAHCHQTLRWLPAVTICGVKLPFKVGCHCAATVGSAVARSLKPGRTLLVGTIGATAAAHCAGGDDRLIAVVLFAVPPCLPVAVSGDGIRGQGTVSLRIPLLCQFWVLRSQIVEPRQNLLPGTDRATGSGDRPGRDGGLPSVPQRAPPPNLAARFSRDLFRRQSTVLLYIPFFTSRGN